MKSGSILARFGQGDEMKYILFYKTYINLQQFQVIPENKTQRNL